MKRENIRIFIFILVILALIWRFQTPIIKIVQSLLSVLILAALLALLIYPLDKALQRRFAPNTALTLAFLGIIVTLATLIAVALPTMVREGRAMIAALPSMITLLQKTVFNATQKLEEWGVSREWIAKANQIISQWQQGSGVQVIEKTESAGLGLGAILAVPMLGFFILKDRLSLRRWFLHMIPETYRVQVCHSGRHIRDAIMRFVGGQLTVSFLTGALTGIALMIMGVRYSLFLGLIMGFCDIVPYFGPIVGAVPILLFSSFQKPSLFFPVLIVVILIQQFEGLYLAPRIIGSRTGLHPAFVLLAIVAGGAVAGVWGMLGAVPLVLTVSVVAQELYLLRVRYRKPFEKQA